MSFRILVTGSNGLLGTKTLALLHQMPDVVGLGASRGPRANGFLGEFPFWQVDLTDRVATQRVVEEARPDAVIHTAAMTDVDGCERAPEQAWRENVDAARHVALACVGVGARLVHLSTEYVFDGTDGPYDEAALPHPLGVYGQSKMASEWIVRAVHPSSVMARTTVVFGAAPNVRPNFVTWAVGQLRAGTSIRVVDDQIGSPTLAENLADMVVALARDPDATGVFNTVGDSVIDRYAFTRLVAQVFDLDQGLIQPIQTSSLKQAAERPLRAGLRMDQFKARYPSVSVLSAEGALQFLRQQIQRTPNGRE